METNLDGVIVRCLEEGRRRVVIPDFGALIRRPGGEVVFVDILNTDDGVFTAEVERQTGMTVDEARRAVFDYSHHLRSELLYRREVNIVGLGTIRLTEDGNSELVTESSASEHRPDVDQKPDTELSVRKSLQIEDSAATAEISVREVDITARKHEGDAGITEVSERETGLSGYSSKAPAECVNDIEVQEQNKEVSKEPVAKESHKKSGRKAVLDWLYGDEHAYGTDEKRSVQHQKRIEPDMTQRRQSELSEQQSRQSEWNSVQPEQQPRQSDQLEQHSEKPEQLERYHGGQPHVQPADEGREDSTFRHARPLSQEETVADRAPRQEFYGHDPEVAARQEPYRPRIELRRPRKRRTDWVLIVAIIIIVVTAVVIIYGQVVEKDAGIF